MRYIKKKTDEITEQFNQRFEIMERQNAQLIEQLNQVNTNTPTHVEIYRNKNIEINRPTFYGNFKDAHPLEFIKKLEEYFKFISAGNWFSTIKFQISDYTEFHDFFIDEYWSLKIQIQLWSSCLNITQVPVNTSYHEHFSLWASRTASPDSTAVIRRGNSEKHCQSLPRIHPGNTSLTTGENNICCHEVARRGGTSTRNPRQSTTQSTT